MIGLVIGGIGGLILLVSICPISLGFGTAGVVAGSVAAGIQSMIGNVIAGSIFSMFQSLAALGVFAIGKVIGIGITAVGGLIVAFFK